MLAERCNRFSCLKQRFYLNRVSAGCKKTPSLILGSLLQISSWLAPWKLFLVQLLRSSDSCSNTDRGRVASRCSCSCLMASRQSSLPKLPYSRNMVVQACQKFWNVARLLSGIIPVAQMITWLGNIMTLYGVTKALCTAKEIEVRLSRSETALCSDSGHDQGLYPALHLEKLGKSSLLWAQSLVSSSA